MADNEAVEIELSEVEKANAWLERSMRENGAPLDENGQIIEEKPPTKGAGQKEAKEPNSRISPTAPTEPAPAGEEEAEEGAGEETPETPEVDAETMRLVGWLVTTGSLDVIEAAAAVAYKASEKVSISLLPIPPALRSVIANMASIGRALAEFQNSEEAER